MLNSKIKTKKLGREKRINKMKKKTVLFTKLLLENKDKDISELLTIYQKIIETPLKSYNDSVLLLVIRNIIDEKYSVESDNNNNTNGNNYKGYPSIYDKNFNKKIYEKKEFNLNKINPLNYSESIEELTDKLCQFNLSNNQKFLKTFISNHTPYNGLLLFHGTGVGKTCSSISIAENFKKVITETNKKIIVLLNPSIKQNFIKNIFNIEKYKSGDVSSQCTKDSYLKEANIDLTSKLDSNVINAKIMKIINNRYSFNGYGAFSNMIENIENEISQKYDDEELINRIFEKKIKDIFSNTILIVDEVHNIKETTDTKILPKILKRVLEIADNLKLILLSATPMFDKPEEIVDILNLLLINDKRTTIKNSQIFDKNNITDEGRVVLVNKSKGYISYLRGEHPIRFPKRLEADIFDGTDFEQLVIKDFPKIDSKKNKIVENDRIKLLKIIGCPMNKYQSEKYNSMNLNPDDSMGSFNISGLTASNIVYPSEDTDVNINQLIGENGFKKIFKKESQNKYSFIDEKYENMFSKGELHKYSSKISTIINNIETSEGIIFIYSQFISAGVLPLSLALENNGYSKYGGSLLHNKSQESYKKDKKFIVISGDNDISKDAYSKYLKIESENKNGEKVKVIIGSQTAAEGLDFKYIREVHILDPWYHFNKIEQVIGRGIRNCSHKDLPKEKRNVVVYLYASTLSPNPSKDIETIDLNLYRICERKMKKISEIEYLLKTSAVDCNLNKEDNRFISEFYNKKSKVITSKNTEHNLDLKDVDNSKICNFRACDFKCNPDLFNKDIKLNEDTFDFNKVRDNIYDIKQLIKNMYTRNLAYLLEDIKAEYVSIYNRENNDILFYALSELIKNKEVFSNNLGKLGVLKKQGQYYIFVPKFLKSQLVSYNNIRRPITKKLRYLNITNYKETKTKQKINTFDEISNKISTFISLLEEEKDELLEDKNFNSGHKQELEKIYYDLKETSNFLFDYIKPELKSKLLELIIERNYNETKVEDELYIKALDKSLLKMKRDVDVMYDGEEYIYGYKIAIDNDIKYVKYDSKTQKFIEPTISEVKLIKKNINIKIRQESGSALIIGYLEYKKSNNSINLKIRDKNYEGKKGTQIKTGSICGNDGMKKMKIVEYIEKTLEDDIYSKIKTSKIKIGKSNLCFELELHLRNYDLLNKKNQRWFYNLEETIERELNKKIY